MTKIDFTPVIKALCLVAGEIHELAKQADGFGGLASGDFHTPTFGPSKDKDEIVSVVKAYDPGASGVDDEAKEPIIEEAFNSSEEHPGG